MREALSRSWVLLVLRGVVAIVLGFLAFLYSQTAAEVLVYAFGFYAIADGLLALITSFRSWERNPRWWIMLLEGLLGIAAGVLAFVLPLLTIFTLLYLIAGWAIATGILEIIAAIRLRKEIDNELVLGLSGLLSIVFGVLIAIFPLIGIVTIVWMVGAYAIMFGILMIVLGLRLRTVQRRTTAVV